MWSRTAGTFAVSKSNGAMPGLMRRLLEDA